MPSRAYPTPVKALARAFRYQRWLDEGRYSSISEMARAERIECDYLSSPLRLTLLAPEIVETVLDGRGSQQVASPRSLKPLPSDWEQQKLLQD